MDTEQLKLRVDYINQLNRQLFQRVNYFFVAIAFLVTAFVALVTTKGLHCSPFLLFLATLICATGFSLSIFFAVMNFLDSNRYKKFGEKLGDESLCYIQWVHALWREYYMRDVIEEGYHVPHVWLIPLAVAAFWEIVWVAFEKSYPVSLGFCSTWILVSVALLIFLAGAICACRKTTDPLHKWSAIWVPIVLLASGLVGLSF